MRLSIILGFIGAAVLPLIYEMYANLSREMALLCCAGWFLFCGARFSAMGLREAFLGVSCTVAYSGVLGWLMYLFVHPRIAAMLMERSVYFQLSLRDQALFVLYVFLLGLLMFLVWPVRAGLRKALEKLRSNRELAGSYIENAFNDEDKEE